MSTLYSHSKDLLIDLCIPAERVVDLTNRGFTVMPRDNFQAKHGWLTGWQVPHSTTDVDFIVKCLTEAFRRGVD